MSGDYKNDPVVIKEFVAEFREYVQELELNVLNLEKDIDNLVLLNEIFRPVHTLKGTAAFLGFLPISEFCHGVENVLDDLRKAKRKATPEIIDILLGSLDIIKRLLDEIESGGDGSKVDTCSVIDKIKSLPSQKDKKSVQEHTAEKDPDAAKSSMPSDGCAQGEVEAFVTAAQQHLRSINKCLAEVSKGNESPKILDNFIRAVRSLKSSAAYMGYLNFKKAVDLEEEVLDAVIKGKAALQGNSVEICQLFCGKAEEFLGEIKKTGKDNISIKDFEEKCSIPKSGELANNNKMEPKPGASGKQPGSLSDHSIRVSMEKLDLLMNLIGELMIDKSRFEVVEHRMQESQQGTEIAKDLRDATASMSRITDELHRAIMDARMIPIGTLFNRFPRVVRELAKKEGKEISLAISGEDTEIDKTIIEEINDPLLHIIRNSVDHGIEKPEDRADKGREGTVHLSARHESGNVVIEIEDDGRGIDTRKVGEKAVKTGIITQEQLSRMSENEIINLIFMPGFSTAEEVTDISGRGVGMDVVKTNIEKLRGKIHIETKVGLGTKITLKLPLTMAIIETLLVKVGNEQFAIPLLAVSTIAQIPATDINKVRGGEAVTLHGRTLSVVRLGEVLQIEHAESSGKIKLVVIETKRGTREEKVEIGFIVDTVCDKQKIVIKPLDNSFVGAAGYSGVTILGDGRVALVLDPVELVEMAMH